MFLPSKGMLGIVCKLGPLDMCCLSFGLPFCRRFVLMLPFADVLSSVEVSQVLSDVLWLDPNQGCAALIFLESLRLVLDCPIPNALPQRCSVKLNVLRFVRPFRDVRRRALKQGRCPPCKWLITSNSETIVLCTTKVFLLEIK